MTYLYGDATAFPLEENFIETISAATDACVALFHLDWELADRRRESRDIAARCDEEVNLLSTLNRAVETALAPMLPKAEAAFAAQGAAQRISQQAAEIIKQSRMEILRQRDTALRSTAQLNLGPRMLDALTPFVLRHQLPKTSWYLRWRGGQQSGEADINLNSTSASGLQLCFRGDIPANSRWLAPVRVEDLMPGVRVELQHEGGWLRRSPTAGKKAAHRFFITQVETTSENVWFELRQNPAKPSLGYEIHIRSSDPNNLLIYPINAKDERADPLSLSGHEAVDLLAVWSTVVEELGALVTHRSELLSARLRGTDIANLDEPAELAEAMLMALAPIVREIRVRSRVPGELVLKRDMGDGRREEVFIPRKELEEKFEDLPHEYRACFYAVGLGSEATSDFLRREFPLQPASEDTPIPEATTPNLARARRIATSDDSDASAA